jgi:hypothetical protein
MSSLLQFGGKITREGVGLLFYLSSDPRSGVEDEAYLCPRDGRRHAVLYEVFRKPVGMMGHWVVFRWGGEEHVPDLSIPIPVTKIPRPARRLSDQEATTYWHSP